MKRFLVIALFYSTFVQANDSIKIGVLNFSREISSETMAKLDDSLFKWVYLFEDNLRESLKKTSQTKLKFRNIKDPDKVLQYTALESPPVTIEPEAEPLPFQVLSGICADKSVRYVILGHLREEFIDNKLLVVIRLFDVQAYNQTKPRYSYQLETMRFRFPLDKLNMATIQSSIENKIPDLLKKMQDTEVTLPETPITKQEPEQNQANQTQNSNTAYHDPNQISSESQNSAQGNSHHTEKNLGTVYDDKEKAPTPQVSTPPQGPNIFDQLEGDNLVSKDTFIKTDSAKKNTRQKPFINKNLHTRGHIYKYTRDHGFHLYSKASKKPMADHRWQRSIHHKGNKETIIVINIHNKTGKKVAFYWYPNLISKNYQSAMAFIHDLNEQNYGGFNDWKIPTLEQLFTLVGTVTNNKGFHWPESFNSDTINPQKPVPLISRNLAKGELPCNEKVWVLEDKGSMNQKSLLTLEELCLGWDAYLIPVRGNGKDWDLND